MNFSQLLKKLKSSIIFKDFKEKNPKAMLCAGFFILDFKQNREEYNLDYKLGDKIATFTIPTDSDMITMREESILDKSKPLNELNPNIKIEIPELKNIVEKKIEKNKIKNKLEKIIAVLQNMEEDKTVWNLTCMCESFVMIIIYIDAITGEILRFEKKSLFDFIKPMDK